jgi:glutaredoxin-related protein
VKSVQSFENCVERSTCWYRTKKQTSVLAEKTEVSHRVLKQQVSRASIPSPYDVRKKLRTYSYWHTILLQFYVRANIGINKLVYHKLDQITGLITERRGRVLNTSASYSGGPEFKSRFQGPTDLTEDFRAFPQSLQANTLNYSTIASHTVFPIHCSHTIT